MTVCTLCMRSVYMCVRVECVALNGFLEKKKNLLFKVIFELQNSRKKEPYN